MRLGGRDLKQGDFVDLCNERDLELYRAANESVVLGFQDLPFYRQGVPPGGEALLGLLDLVDARPLAVNPLDRFREWAS